MAVERYNYMALTIDSVLDDPFPDLVFHSHNQNKPTAERRNAVDTARTFFQMENTLLTMMRYVLLLLVVLTCLSGCLLPVDARLHEQQQLRDTTDVVSLPNNNNYSNISMCERIHPEDLPAECLCREKPPLGLLVECLKVFNSTFFNDTIGLKIDLDPCNPEGSSCSIDVTERNNNIDYPIERIRAGEEQDFPIPGLAVVVPGLGHVGMDVVRPAKSTCVKSHRVVILRTKRHYYIWLTILIPNVLTAVVVLFFFMTTTGRLHCRKSQHAHSQNWPQRLRGLGPTNCLCVLHSWTQYHSSVVCLEWSLFIWGYL